MKMTIRLMLVIALISLCAISVNAQTFLFIQDNFKWVYGTAGSPHSAGSTFSSTGVLKDWSVDNILYNYTWTGKATNAGTVSGSEWTMFFNTSTLTINDVDTNAVLWQGTGSMKQLDKNGSPYAAVYPRPGYEDQPVEFLAHGFGDFTKTAGSGSLAGFYAMKLDWFGTYNWGNVGTKARQGNAQGQLTALPEATSVMLGMMGLSSLVGFGKLRRKH